MLLDQITLSDLEIFSDSSGGGGISALFVQTETLAGRRALHRRLRAPASSVVEITEVQDAVRFFSEDWRRPLLQPGLLDSVERHLDSNIDLGPDVALSRDFLRSVWLSFRDEELCRELKAGVTVCSEVLSAGDVLARTLLASDAPTLVRSLAEGVAEVLGALGAVPQGMSLLSAIRQDRFFRTNGRDSMQRLVGYLAELDALRTMGATTRELSWTLPEFVESDSFVFEGDGLHHPFVEDSTRNPVAIAGGEPLVFLTGPNMAGKTTYMRSVGLAALLAQVGMGVPATRLRMTPVDVLLTGLNPSDNLRAGLSFFFAEVLRVKEAAEHLAAGRRCLVLFDEVFKGTNVRDALDASLAVITGFARSRGSGCVFSSHLVELAEPLAALGRVRFYHFEGEVVEGRARYSYRLRPGVSRQRFGLQLLEEANVPALLDQIGE